MISDHYNIINQAQPHAITYNTDIQLLSHCPVQLQLSRKLTLKQD